MKIIAFALTVFVGSVLLTDVTPAQLKIGLALPLQLDDQGNPTNPTGELMLKGINDALNEFKETDSLMKIDVLTEDTKRDPSSALDAVNKFGNNKDVIAVIGPVFSNELIVSAGAAAFHKMPVVSPTATVNNAASENAYLFQINPTYDVRGRLMAEFAMEKLGMRNFLVLSEDSYGKQYSDAFASEVRDKGDSVLFSVYYSRDDWDISDEVAELIRFASAADRFIDFGSISVADLEKFWKAGLEKSATDTLIAGRYLMSIHRILNDAIMTELINAGIKTTAYNDKAFNVVFGAVDAVYIPVSRAAETDKIALELYRKRFNIPVLGTSDWNNEEALKNNAKFLHEIWLESDFVLKENLSGPGSDAKEADIRNYYFGYGTMQMLLSLIKQGAVSREAINGKLGKLSDYSAPYNKISLINRTNQCLNVIGMRSGSVISSDSYCR